MSSNCKTLKILSFVQVLVAVLAFVLAGIAGAGDAAAGDEAGIVGVILVHVENILYAVLGVLALVSAITGIHGANRPTALGSHKLFSILEVLWAVLTCVIAGMGAGIPWVAALAGILGIAVAIFDGKIRKELDGRLGA